jgi:hypothetical protein
MIAWLKAPRSKPALKLVAKDLAKAVGLSRFVFLVRWHFETNPSGKSLRDFQFALLRAGLSVGALDEPQSQVGSTDLPVVFDISRLHPNKALPTDHHALDTIIKELDGETDAEREAGPKAIGVDLEFAEYFDKPEDYAYLASWKKLHAKVKVGVYRRSLKRSQFWLGLPDFSEMAVGIALPKDDPNHAFLYSCTCFKKKSENLFDDQDLPVKCEVGKDPTIERDKDLIQLPTAMWEILHDAVNISKLKNQSTKSPDSRLLELGEYFIDYSYLKQIQNEIIAPTSISDIHAVVDNLKNLGKLKNRIVLIGDLEDVNDRFCQIPSERPIAGALIHACSIATLNRALLPEIDNKWSHVFEAIFLVCLLFSIAGLRLLYFYSPRAHQWDYQYIEILVFGTMAVVIYVVFKVRIRDVGYVWPDFLWVSAALFIHPFLTEPFYRTCVAVPNMLRVFAATFARPDSGGNHDR